jgi:hypothetical protein
MGIKIQLICTCGKGTFRLRLDESIEAQLEDHLSICEICMRNHYDDPYMCEDCMKSCNTCDSNVCPEHYDNDIEMCQDCKEERSQCNTCNDWIYNDDLVLNDDYIAICQSCKDALEEQKELEQ